MPVNSSSCRLLQQIQIRHIHLPRGPGHADLAGAAAGEVAVLRRGLEFGGFGLRCRLCELWDGGSRGRRRSHSSQRSAAPPPCHYRLARCPRASARDSASRPSRPDAGDRLRLLLDGQLGQQLIVHERRRCRESSELIEFLLVLRREMRAAGDEAVGARAGVNDHRQSAAIGPLPESSRWSGSPARSCAWSKPFEENGTPQQVPSTSAGMNDWHAGAAMRRRQAPPCRRHARRALPAGGPSRAKCSSENRWPGRSRARSRARRARAGARPRSTAGTRPRNCNASARVIADHRSGAQHQTARRGPSAKASRMPALERARSCFAKQHGESLACRRRMANAGGSAW